MPPPNPAPMRWKAASSGIGAVSGVSGMPSSTCRRIANDCSTSRARIMRRARTSPPVFDRDLEPKTLIRVVRMVAPQVRIHAGRARGHPDDPEVARRLVREDAGRVNAVGERARVDEHRDQVVELFLQRAKVRGKLVAAVGRQIVLHPAERDRAAQQPRAEQPFLQAHQAFAQRLRPGGRHGERDVGRHRADV